MYFKALLCKGSHRLHQTAHGTKAGHCPGRVRSFKRLLIQTCDNENVTQAVSTGDRFQRSFNLHSQNLLLSATQPANGIATPH
jgi:hypothetical protein